MKVSSHAYTIFILIILFVLSGVAYPYLPDRMATHWDFRGDANGFSGKFFGLFFLPLLSVSLYLILIAVPILDPLRKNIEKFRSHYHRFILVILCFLLYLHLIALLWNLEFVINITRATIPAFVVLFYYLALFLGKCEQNWFIGIRTPWTLSSTFVWKKTHQLGMKLFKGCAVLAAVGFFVPNLLMLFVVAPVILSTLILVIYSYIIFRTEVHEHKSSTKR